MSFTYSPDTDIGRVRRTIPDRDYEEFLWSDEEIQSFLDDEGGWRRATALALETMASDSAMVLQVIRIHNISTDGATVARALLTRAAMLRDQAANDDALAGDAFDVIEVVVDDFSYRNRIYSQALRNM